MVVNELKPVVSVVSPCYNVGKYLGRFLDGLALQSYKKLEIILVDDGSIDDTGKLLDDFAKSDSRVKVIHKENGGCSSARLAGILASSGEYIYSCDPDDYMESTCIEALVETALENDADMVYCDYNCIYVDKIEPVTYRLKNTDKLTFLQEQLVGGMWGVFWNKLIRKSLMDNHKVYPDIRVSLWDDYHVVNGCAAYANKIACCPKILYHYNCENQGSIMHNVTRKSYESIVLAINLLSKHLEKSGVMPYVKEDFLQLCYKNKGYLLNSQYRDYGKWRELWPESNKYALQNSIGINHQIIKCIIDGNDRTAYFLSLLQRIVKHF